MLIGLNHPNYKSIELVGESLIIHPMQGDSKTLQEGVKDFTVAIKNGEIQIVAFIEKDYAWFYTGQKEFDQTRVEFGQLYGGGGKLIVDEAGNSHLFYFVQQSAGHSVLLRHQIFREKWSTPMMVSTNVFSRGNSFSAAWHGDNYLHIAYCNHREQHLLYRVFDQEHGTWSGAVPFSQKRCSSPSFISGEKLYLLWQEEGAGTTSLKVKTKEQTWSTTQEVSGTQNVTNVGFTIDGELWHVLWSVGRELYKAPFNSWSKFEEVDREEYTYLVMAQAGGVFPIYKSVKEQVIPAKEVPQPQERPVQKQVSHSLAQEKEKEEKQIQAAFIEKAFRTLHEWENFRTEIKQWQNSFTPPMPVDLSEITSRIDRLERRIFSLQQSQDKQKDVWEDFLRKVEDDLGRTQRRLASLENLNQEKNKPTTSLWRKVLNRL